MENQNQALRAGTTLNGDQYIYRIERILGQGAFGITYLATTEIVGKFGRLPVKVALKEYFAKELNSRAEDGSVRDASSESLAGRYGKAFQREALNLSHLEHPGIVSVLEAFAANNTWYYAMEYIEGGSLDEYIVRRGGLPEQEAIAAIREIGSALSFMHNHKMLHLDLKPKNIMRREDGHLVLIDFGLSKQYAAEGEAESSTTIGLGTPGYAPLEQSQLGSGKFFSPSLDVYALSATLFKMLSGKTPPNSSEVFNQGFPEGDLRARGISENVLHAIEKGMAPQQVLRPQSVSEFLALLNGPVASAAEEVEEETTVIAKPEAAVKAEPKNEPKPAPKIELAPAPKPKPSSEGPGTKALLWVLLGGLVVVGILLGVIFGGKKKHPDNLIVQIDSTEAVSPIQTEIVPETVLETQPEQAAPGSVKVSSTPAGASIWLDGRNTKKITPDILEDLTPGKHTIKLVLEDYNDYSGSVTIISGKRSDLSKTLTVKENSSQQTQTHTQTTSQTNQNSQTTSAGTTENATTGSSNGHDWVDLGLSVKWATTNVGASSPSDYGRYYAWGETSPKNDYSVDTYKWCNGSYDNLSKYNTDASYGTVDNKTRLDRADDAARANWGGSWRMPTNEEFEELIAKCSWTWTSKDGKNGYKVTGKNGNSIFFPAAGVRTGTSVSFAGSNGLYWSSSLDTDYPDGAWTIMLDSSVVMTGRSGYRDDGYTVRPVIEIE